MNDEKERILSEYNNLIISNNLDKNREFNFIKKELKKYKE